MKKLLLPLALIVAATSVDAQSLRAIKQDVSVMQKIYSRDGVPFNTNTPRLLAPLAPKQNKAIRSVNAVQIGVAGNLYTVLNDGTKSLYADDSVGTVTFIHRGPGDTGPKNKGQFVYDISKDNGATWTTNVGPLNPSGIYTGTPSARFPQAAIFRPNNTTNADSAYIVYSGAWLDYTSSGGGNDQWEGDFRGVGRLDGNASTYTESADLVNGGYVGVAEGFKTSGNGVFWNLNVNYREETDINTGGIIYYRDSLIITKGVWNTTTKTVDWTETQFAHHALVADVDGSGSSYTLLNDFDIAFAPDGQTGWLALKGDFLDDGKYTYDPVFYKTTDGGNTWGSPIYVNLTSLQQIYFDLNPDLSKVATTINASDLSVDAFGNPHYAILALSAAVTDQAGDTVKYNYYPNGGIGLYDVTFDPSAGNGCEWKAVFLEQVISGNPGSRFTEDQSGAAIPLETRVNISRSRDGKKLFFTWLDTDFIQGVNPDPADNFYKNISPNLFGKGFDVQSQKLTITKNFTANDAQFGGDGIGSFGGAMFPMVSPTTILSGTTNKIPVVLAEVDFAQSNFNSKYGTNPARFYYINDLQFTDAEFTEVLGDSLPPIITLNGNDTIVVLLGGTYTEQGATALDCKDGTITPVVSGNVDPNTAGNYEVTYIAVDNAGNADTATRIVLVGRDPIANFNKKTEVQVGNGKRLTLEDKSTFSPTSWSWSFGAGASPAISYAKNPVVTYTTGGQKCIKLTVTNSFGSDDTTICYEVTVGINEVIFNQSLSVYPNPSNGQVFVSVAGLDNEKATVTVMNTLGDVVLPAITRVINGSETIVIDGSKLAAGSYLVKIQAATATAVRQISIVK
ncbi:MAG: DUF5011 domain-containing protein [Chitinophagales bacterium]|nr:DUF5011 domain-containing protein [Chitinophagales bacterium]